MSHPLVTQLHFARREFERCLAGVSEADAVHRLQPMNSISWIVGHLANQEHAYWVIMAQGRQVVAGLNDLVGYGKPATTPPLAEMWATWRTVTAAADEYLAALSDDKLSTYFEWQGQRRAEDVGTLLLRNIYHYWFHTGEAHAIRQMLGHPDLPQFVGNMAGVEYR